MFCWTARESAQTRITNIKKDNPLNFRLLTLKFRPLIACAIFLAPPIIATSQEAARAPLLEGIGPLQFTITTDNTRSQAYFNQAMTLSFGFNHAEAVRSFQEAARLDPSCGICYAGIALALGPNINAPMNPEAVRPAWEAAQTALKLSKGESGFEQDFIEAIATRYSEGGTDRAAHRAGRTSARSPRSTPRSRRRPAGA